MLDPRRPVRELNVFQKAILRYTPVSLQNVSLSIWGYQIHRFRYTRCFHRRLAELDNTATAPIERLYEIQRERLLARVKWARQYVPRYRDLPTPSTKKDSLEAIRETLDSIPPLEKNEYAKDPFGFLSTDRSRARLVKNNTSGTTGTALEFWHTREALTEEHATV
jgi:phenylacetate-CoA ligase